MKKELINLVYIINNNNIKGSRIIKKLEEYGGINAESLVGDCVGDCYFITPENTIYCGLTQHFLSILKLAGYRDITAELGVVEYTIEEIAKLLGKDPDSIRIKK
jgi:hypothetical protein